MVYSCFNHIIPLQSIKNQSVQKKCISVYQIIMDYPHDIPIVDGISDEHEIIKDFTSRFEISNDYHGISDFPMISRLSVSLFSEEREESLDAKEPSGALHRHCHLGC